MVRTVLGICGVPLALNFTQQQRRKPKKTDAFKAKHVFEEDKQVDAMRPGQFHSSTLRGKFKVGDLGKLAAVVAASVAVFSRDASFPKRKNAKK